MPAPHHSVFYRPDALTAAQPSVKALKVQNKAIFKATNKTKLNSSHWPQPFSDHQPPSEERGQKLPPHQLFYINTLYNIHYRANLI